MEPGDHAYAGLRHNHLRAGSLGLILRPGTPSEVAEALAFARADMAPHTDGLYLSFDTDTRPERLADAVPGETLGRLRRLKRQWDPDNVFRTNFPIPSADDERPEEAPEAAALPV